MKSKTEAGAPKQSGDVVLQEMWRIKDALSAAYGHDVNRLFTEARERQERSGRRVVNLQSTSSSSSR